MTKVVREIGVLSVGKVAGIVYACIGLIVGALVALVSVLGGFAGLVQDRAASAGFLAMFVGVGAVFVLPVFYGVLGSLVGMLVAVVYNVAARLVGGIQVTVD